MGMRLLDAENLRQLVHQLFFVFAVNALDLRKLQSFLAQLEDGHSLQIFPLHKNLRSNVSGFVRGLLPQNQKGNHKDTKAQRLLGLTSSLCAFVSLWFPRGSTGIARYQSCPQTYCCSGRTRSTARRPRSSKAFRRAAGSSRPSRSHARPPETHSRALSREHSGYLLEPVRGVV